MSRTGEKRKAGAHSGDRGRPEKKAKQGDAKEAKGKLVFEPRPDWHAIALPSLEQSEVTTLPPQRTIDDLHSHAHALLEAENATYNASHLSGSSSHKFLSTIMSSGTLEDKVYALTLLVQESPLHTMKAFENLLGLAKKRSRNQALMAVAALKDLLGQGVMLPDRKLRAFGKQPAILSALQGKSAHWSLGDALPGGIEKRHLMVWAVEDWLKKKYFELLQVLESWCNDEIEYSRSRAVTYVWELLKDKPEQEENLLRLLVNKLGDTDRKIASRASYLLLQLENTHPAMRMVVTNSIEADCLFKPNQSQHAKYYAIITLNQTILSQKEEALAIRLLGIYFSLFTQLLKPVEEKRAATKPQPNGKQQGGGGKAGKMAAKKRKAEERNEEAEGQLREKMMAQVLTGVNRAFPFADTSDPTFEKQMDTIFRVAHSANFNTAIQALLLIQQISSTKHYGAERFYRTLYESLLDPRLATSSKQVMYLNLLYKSLKSDLNAKRVQAFVKRLLQIITMHDPPFACGVLYLISELEATFPSIRTMITEPEVDEEDEEEHFADVPEDVPEATTTMHPDRQSAQDAAAAKLRAYDPRKRNPEHAHADRTALWDLLPFLCHFHPSVSLFANSLIAAKEMPPKPDPAHLTLMHFLDRFVYRNAKTKPEKAHGASIMQPLAGSSGRADMLVKPGGDPAGVNAVPVNSEAFWRKKVEDVAADEVFFHSYFNQAGKGKMADRKAKKAEKKDAIDFDGEGSESEEDEAEEEEIWEALSKSRPDIEGPDEDDDLSIGDLEDAYSDDDEGSEPGLDLGGDDADFAEGGAEDKDLQDEFADMDGLDMNELESDDDALLDSDDEAAVNLGDEEEEAHVSEKTKRNRDKRKEKKKLKSLPTFASVEEYAKLLADEPDEEY
ncbi:CBF-domain-containing protein [Teratosphaeria nubilosa]|uniref:CBF-domain-containing protein n=1 Tax=Teratosphaeria nubilosa TaxID=161662 RepID=A0A6G1LFZ1_9PEZI|nr:CBF-domain-containing protein [Teratosphaeria nubilosa]